MSRSLLAFAALALMAAVALLGGPTPSQAEAKLVAAYQTTDIIKLTISVPASTKSRVVTVELLDATGKSLSRLAPVLPAGPATQTTLELPNIKGNLQEYKVRLTMSGTSSDTPLNKLLLVRAHETALTASTEYYAGSQAELTCRVYGVQSLTKTIPLVSDVQVTLVDAAKKSHELYTGQTGSDGLARIPLRIPDVASGSYTLKVRTRSMLGEETLTRSVTIRTAPKVLLTSDKPLYQPGQTMHLRALALRAFDLKPAEKANLLFEIEDAKGNKVFKKEVPTSEFGIAAVDFTLADEVNMGEYRLRALLGDYSVEKTVTVKKYVLPKFKTELKTNKRFYLPKETIQGTLQVDYFFGKPVAGGKVEIKASTFDVAFKEFATFKGTTDKSGLLTFEIALPNYFVGTPLAGGNALVKLDVQVTDTADHSETLTRTYPVSDQPIRVSFLPEGGRLIPELENRVFVAALYPDGSPALCQVDVFLGPKAEGKPEASLRTNAAGLAEFRFTPKAGQFRSGNWGSRMVEMLGGTTQQFSQLALFDLSAQARDDRGAKAVAKATLSSEPFGENVLLRLDKAIYRGGDKVQVEIHTSAGLPTVYLDVIKSGQTMLTRWLDVKDGKATTSLDLPAHLFGTLEIHAYQVLASSEIIRDARVVYVNSTEELRIQVTPDRAEYLPGAKGLLRFEVTNAQGKPTPAALGVLVVDEAVYALQEMQPGLEKVFFTLQEEMLKPAVQADFKPGEPLDVLVRQPELPPDKQQTAQALLTAVRPKPPGRWQIDPMQTRRHQLDEKLGTIGWSLLNYAAHTNSPKLLQQDRATGKWTLRRDALETLVKQNHLTHEMLDDGFGGRLTLDRVQELEPGFTAERLMNAITFQRMQSLLWMFLEEANRNQRAWLKGGKWTFPDDVLERAGKRYGNVSANRDAWDRPFKLIKRSAKEKNQTGYHQFDDVVLTSAGADGKFGTEDDVTYTSELPWELGMYWWQSSSTTGSKRLGRIAETRLRFFQRERLAEERGMAFEMRAAPGRGGGLGGIPAPVPAMPQRDLADATKAAGKADSEPSAEPTTRLREYFPETLFWQPALVTDDQGRATLELPFADSITTWRLTASGSSRGGLLGGVTAPLRVFQDFFVDLDLPVALTRNDEVAFPVAVYNYLKTPQNVTLTLQSESWFELIDAGGFTRQLSLQPGEVTSVRFRIKAKKVGTFPLTVQAQGSKMSDAIKRSIEVLADGERMEQVFSDRLQGGVQHKIRIPAEAIPEASKLFVKVYPGVISQVVEGMEGMLRMPTGCFEQTSSSAYPNILVVDYIKKSRQASPALLARAETFLSAGYQRLLTFERPGGGFDWWGTGEPLIWLSAYGLQEFNDMARVYPIDRAILDRTRTWLMSQQDKDGTWSKIGSTHGESIERMGDPKLLLTSYVAWSILDSMDKPAGWQKSPDGVKLGQAISYIRKHAPKADNAYILALAANALAAWDAKDDSTHDVLKQLLVKLDGLQQRKPEWKAICFPAGGQSISYGRDDALVVETTALATLAMLKHGGFTNSVNQALTYLVKTKNAQGHWGSTQATILALKAMILGLGGTPPKEAVPFSIHVNGKKVADGEVNERNADLLQQFDLTAHLVTGESDIAIEAKGETPLTYQVVARHFEPRRERPQPEKPILTVNVEYDRTTLSTADLLKAQATLRYSGKVPTYNVIVDLPIPPGFTVDAGDFAELVAAKKVQKFSVTARQVILYLGDVRPASEHRFDYALKPKYPIKAQAAPAVAYEYYTPANRAESKPVQLTVEEKK